MIYDCIIIGNGPAGISAALYTIRSNMKTLVIGTGDSTLKKASEIENYYGFSEPISGENSLTRGKTAKTAWWYNTRRGSYWHR